MILTIGPLTYTVRGMTEDDEGLGENMGECCRVDQEILIDGDFPPCRQASVLMHEVVHAAWEAYMMPPKATEEQVAEFVGTILMGVIRQNPHLLRAVTDAWDHDLPVVLPAST